MTKENQTLKYMMSMHLPCARRMCSPSLYLVLLVFVRFAIQFNVILNHSTTF